MKKVPKCNECENCKRYHIVIDYLYCEKAVQQICVGFNCKKTPNWCPLREK